MKQYDCIKKSRIQKRILSIENKSIEQKSVEVCFDKIFLQ